MSEERQSKLHKFHCPACAGKGILEGRSCPECDGVGVWAEYEGWIVYATLPKVVVTDLHYQLQHTFALCLRWLLLAGGILCLLVGLRNLLALDNQLTLSYDRFFALGIWSAAFFGLIWFWLTYFYWMTRGRHPLARVPAKANSAWIAMADTDMVHWHDIKQKQSSRSFVELTSLLSLHGRQVFDDVLEEARVKKRRVLRPYQLLRRLTQGDEITTLAVRLNLDLQAMQTFVQNLLGEVDLRADDDIIISARLKDVLIDAFEESWLLGHASIRQRDLVLSFVKGDERTLAYFRDQRIYLSDVRNVTYWLDRQEEKDKWWTQLDIKSFKRSGKMDLGWSSGWTVTLDKYSKDLTKAARKGRLREVIGRTEEISDLARILGRSSKSSVLLIGDPGVGKTSLVEGLAQRIVEGNVVGALRNKRVVELNVGSLVGASDNGNQFSQVASRVLEEASRSHNVILAIDNIHTLKGAGAGAGSGLDAFSIFEPALTRSEFQCVGTTTMKEYSRFVETNESFARCFSTLEVKEPEFDDLVKILETVVLQFEQKQKVIVTYQAIKAAITFGNKYIHDNVQPDKAIDLLDEAAVLVGKQSKRKYVLAEDIAAVVSNKTKIPVNDITVDETDRLLKLESIMHERLVGQDEAVSMVANAVRRSRVGLRDQHKPIANFLFVGSTGVGKTELAKTLAEVYFGHEKLMVRFDMSEFVTKESIYRLIGAPPGESSSDAGFGQLTEAVRHRPFCLVLLDEFEKANADVHNLFLQVFDDGRLTDSTGRLVDFSNTIIIATSNAGAKMIQDGVESGRNSEEIKQDLLHNVLPQYYRPELLNRFDGIIVFKPLGQDEIYTIAERMLRGIQEKLKEQDINFKITKEAVKKLSELGFDPLNGARPLRRVIQSKIEDPIAGKVLRGDVRRGDTLIIREQDL